MYPAMADRTPHDNRAIVVINDEKVFPNSDALDRQVLQIQMGTKRPVVHAKYRYRYLFPLLHHLSEDFALDLVEADSEPLLHQ
jgi:hypothetical protein